MSEQCSISTTHDILTTVVQATRTWHAHLNAPTLLSQKMTSHTAVLLIYVSLIESGSQLYFTKDASPLLITTVCLGQKSLLQPFSDG